MNEHDIHDLPEDDRRRAELTAHVLGELEGEAKRRLDDELARSSELREERARLERTLTLVGEAMPADELSPEVRATLRAAAEREAGGARPIPAGWRFLRGGASLARIAAAVAVVGIGAYLWQESRVAPRHAFTDEVARLEGESERDDRQALSVLGYSDGSPSSAPTSAPKGGSAGNLKKLGYIGPSEPSSRVPSREKKIAQDSQAESLRALGYPSGNEVRESSKPASAPSARGAEEAPVVARGSGSGRREFPFADRGPRDRV